MINRAEIDHMARLRDIMNGNTSTPMPQATNTGSNSPNVGMPKDTVNINDDMKNILTKMYEASGETERLQKNVLTEEAATQPTITKRMVNERSYFVKVGLKPCSKTRRTYSVMNEDFKEPFKDIQLFESAYLIAEYLNEGRSLSDVRISNIVDLEEDYKVAVKECVFFKDKIKRCKQLNESEAGSVFEKKFKISKAKAESVHESIKARLASL